MERKSESSNWPQTSECSYLELISASEMDSRVNPMPNTHSSWTLQLLAWVIKNIISHIFRSQVGCELLPFSMNVYILCFWTTIQVSYQDYFLACFVYGAPPKAQQLYPSCKVEGWSETRQQNKVCVNQRQNRHSAVEKVSAFILTLFLQILLPIFWNYTKFHKSKGQN